MDTGGQQKEILKIRNQGLNLDDENEAVAEILPVASEVLLPTDQQLGWDDIDHQKNHNFTNESDLITG